MSDMVREFIRVAQATKEEAYAVLDVSDWDPALALKMFYQYPRQVWTAMPTAWRFALARFSLDSCDIILKCYIHCFPKDVFDECSQGLAPEDYEHLSIVALNAFSCSGTNEEFVQFLQLGKAVVLPLFQEWAKEVKEMAKAFAESLDYGAARERFKVLLNETLPSVVEANPAFCYLVKDVINCNVHCDDNVTQTALHVAAKLGDLDLVTNLLKRDAWVYAVDDIGDRVLHVGVNHPSIVALLLSAAEQAQQLVKHFKEDGQTALHLCRNAESACLLLRAAPALLFGLDVDDNTALHLNVNEPDIVELFLSEIEDSQRLKEFVEQVNCEGETALHLCHNAESARLLLRVAPDLLFVLDKNGNTALHLAMESPDLVEVLLSAVEDTQQRELLAKRANYCGDTALHACEHAESARLLLRVSPDLVSAINQLKRTALHSLTKKLDVIEVLLTTIQDAAELEQFVNQLDICGNSALHFCRDMERAQLILRISPNLAVVANHYGYTALHPTTHIPGVVEVILSTVESAQQRELLVKRANDLGETALHLCKSADSARLLLRVSPDLVLVKNKLGCTALHTRMHQVDVAEVLLAAIQDATALEQLVQQLDDGGCTALHFCRNMEGAQLLLRISPNLLFVEDRNGNTALHSGADCPDLVEFLLNAAGEAGQLAQFVKQANNDGQTALHLCHNADSARLLLQALPSLAFAKDKLARSALHSNADFPGVVEVLLAEIKDARELEAYVGKVDKLAQTALHVCKDAESARMLLDIAPGLVFSRDYDRRTALHKCVDCLGVVEVLLDAIPDPQELKQFVQQVNILRYTALHLCTNAESARMLLRICPDLLFAVEAEGKTALHLNADNADVVNVCLNVARGEAGRLARFVEQVDDHQQTALYLCQNTEIVRLLIEASPNLVSIKCKAGCTPLHIHAMRGLVDNCRLLLEHGGADVNAVNARWQTPLHLAYFFRQVEVVELLLAHSAQVLDHDYARRTVLHYALQQPWKFADKKDEYLTDYLSLDNRYENATLLELLLMQSEADVVAKLVAARDADGRTALHYFVVSDYENLDLVDKLMMAGANAAAQDYQGNTAMHLALRIFAYLPVALHLVKLWGSSVRIKNYAGKTALDLEYDPKRRAKLERLNMLAGAVTLRLAARPRVVQSPWRRFPHELFRELCLFLV